MADTQDKREQRERQHYRVGGGDASVDSSKSISDRPQSSASTEPVRATFSQMINERDEVYVAGKMYGIKACPMRKLAQIGQIIRLCPGIFIAKAMLSREEENDLHKIAEKMNQIYDLRPDDQEYYTNVSVERQILAVVQSLDDVQVQSMLDLVEAAVKTVRPDMPADEMEELKDAIDTDAFVTVLRIVFEKNTGLMRRF